MSLLLGVHVSLVETGKTRKYARPHFEILRLVSVVLRGKSMIETFKKQKQRENANACVTVEGKIEREYVCSAL